MNKQDLKHGQWVLIKGKAAQIKLDDDLQFYVEPKEGKVSMLCIYDLNDIEPMPKKRMAENY